MLHEPETSAATASGQPPKIEVVGVDMLRFAAAFMVMMFHLSFWDWAAPASRTNSLLRVGEHYGLLSSVASAGWVGVEIFFVISGYVITWSAQATSAGGFARGRFLRLAPAAWICATTTVVAAVAIAGVDWRALWKPYLRTISFYPTSPWVDDAYWTLDVEIAFYGLVCILLALGLRSKLAVALGTLGVTSALFWIAHAVAAFHPHLPGAGFLLAAARSRYTELLLIQHGCLFCIGAVMYFLSIGRRTVALEAIAIVCVAGSVIEIVSSTTAKADVTGVPLSPVGPISIWATMMLVMMAAIWFNGALSRLVGGGRARRLGLTTYPLYLLHTFIGSITIKALVGFGVGDGPALACAIVLVLALAFGVSEHVEPPAKRAVSALLDSVLGRLLSIASAAPASSPTGAGPLALAAPAPGAVAPELADAITVAIISAEN